MKIHFVDTETTGLGPHDELVEICIATWDDGATDIRYHANYHPSGLVTPEAQAVNGYNARDWCNRTPPAEGFHYNHCTHIDAALRDSVIWGGSNPAFDRQMIDAAYRRVRFVSSKYGHRNIDTASLAAPLLLLGLIKHPGLDALREYFGLPVPPLHDAKTDVLDSIKIFERLIDGACRGWLVQPPVVRGPGVA